MVARMEAASTIRVDRDRGVSSRVVIQSSVREQTKDRNTE